MYIYEYIYMSTLRLFNCVTKHACIVYIVLPSLIIV